MAAPAEVEALENEIAEVCGVINAATARLVRLIARVLETGASEGAGIHSAEQWVAWKCGVSSGRARRLVAMARRLVELPEVGTAFDAGELGEEQVAVVCRHAPAATDAQMAEFARHATVGQLRRTVSAYSFAGTPAGEPAPATEERRHCDFGFTDTGDWRLSALLPPDEGALVEKALGAARDELFHAGDQEEGRGPSPRDVSWADALVAMADRSLGGQSRPLRERTLVLLHVPVNDGDADHAHLHLGPGLADGLRRYLGCDSRVRAVFESAGKAVSVGRAWRTVPERTRIVVEERDRGCRVPGCERTRWLHVHHITHWEDGGPTDTANLLALCARHHRLHHLGRLGIRGNADDPDGVVFSDERGRELAASGRPVPPRGPLPAPSGTWRHPSGERIDRRWVYFNEPAAAS